MKHLLVTGLSILFVTAYTFAQTKQTQQPNAIINQGYYEFNFGAAFIEDFEIPFPGISFLIGNKTYFENNLIFDAEIGLALPSIATAKLGLGYKVGKSEIIVGVRPWPLHYYLQTQLSTNERGGWIMSVEISSLAFRRTYNDTAYEASMYSLGMINFGYRWNIKRSK